MNSRAIEEATLVRVKNVGEGVIGVEVSLPNAPPLIVIAGKRGFIMCGYLDIITADKLNAVAARVRGVKNVEEMLSGEIETATSRAMELGIRAGVKVKEVIDLLS
ncbi:MAG: DUF1805 domain-containing protein [Sulfolobales archaeon]|nr:DUF1805 domain-containing protein [Sulfolobales archaeon]MCX8198649.1 DUF1805 domain-containing protein [Sulfolobales archaeon]MDW8169723.1 DUF1805 domain-containing protein [Desulfurococcaceae archaeon]